MKYPRFLGFFVLLFLLAATLILDIYLLFWEKMKGFKIFPGS
jgi:hypothetical protein